MPESHEYFEPSQPAHSAHLERAGRKTRKPSLLKYATLAPAAALTAITIGCQNTEQEIEDSISPTSTARHLETATPHLEAPVKIMSAGVEIELADEVRENVSPTGRSIDQDSRAVIEVAQKFPLPDRFRATLTNDYKDDQAVGPEGKIIIGRNRIRTETMQFSVAHELTHILDPIYNEEFLNQFYTPHQISELQKLREEILSDPVWGRDYPSIDKMLSGKLGANVIPGGSESPAQIAAGADIDANGIWIGGYNPFESDLASSYTLLDQAKTEKNDYGSLKEFIGDNRSLINSYFEATPLAKYAREDFYRLIEMDTLTSENTAWTAQTDNKAYLGGRFAPDIKEAVKRITNMILFEKYETGRLEEFINSQPDSKQDFYKKAFEFKRDFTDQEKFANVIASAVHTNSPGKAREFLERIATYNEVNKILEEKPQSAGNIRLAEFDRANNLVRVDPNR